jgi:hypothetical protein
VKVADWSAPPSLMDRLLQAIMARLPPVSEEYFYSHHGAISKRSAIIVEILASLQQESQPGRDRK